MAVQIGRKRKEKTRQAAAHNVRKSQLVYSNSLNDYLFKQTAGIENDLKFHKRMPMVMFNCSVTSLL